MNYLPDTNAWVDHLRQGVNSKVTAKLIGSTPGSVYLGSIVLAELLYGVQLSSPTKQAANASLVFTLRNHILSWCLMTEQPTSMRNFEHP